MSTQTTQNIPIPSIQDWNAELYDNHHGFVSRLAIDLIKLLNPQYGERILDLGCGTGYLTYRITAFGAEVTGIDGAATMIEQATQAYPQLSFEVADATCLDIKEQFDAVFSNAALHWIKPPEAVVGSICQALKPGGRFVAEFGGYGNVETIINAVSEVLDEVGYPNHPNLNPWYFPRISEYSTLLESHGFIVQQANLFDRPTPLDGGSLGLRNWLKMFAGCFFQEIPVEQHQLIYSKIEKKLRPKLYHNKTWIADYKRLRVLAVKTAA
ncbi:MAG: class I SAM-dependent methyltransferase [Microcoleaceae cyanobacterium]